MRNNPKKAPKITLYIYWILQKLGDSLRERNPDQQKNKSCSHSKDLLYYDGLRSSQLQSNKRELKLGKIMSTQPAVVLSAF